MNSVTSLRAFFHRFLLALVLATAFAGIGIGGSYWVFDEKVNDAETTTLDLDAEEKGEPANFLIIGSDTRAFVDDGSSDEEHFGSSEEQVGQRSDTIMIAHVDPDTKTGMLVSFPRDLWVNIPELGEAKLNAAFNAGPQRVVDTIQSNFNVDIHHYIEVDFSGFRNLVDAIGTVPIYFPSPARDTKSGLYIDTAGCHELNGDQALTYVRSRQYEYQDENGNWDTDGTADLGRIARQQYFMRTLANEAVHAGVRNPTKLLDLLDKMLDNIVIDDGLSSGDLRALARTFRNSDPGTVEMVTIPSRREFINGQDAQVVIPEEAEPILERLRSFGEQPDDEEDEPIPDIPPGEIEVAVRNGSSVTGLARSVFDGLANLGFATAGTPGNADNSDYDSTEVRYGPGGEDKARVVLSTLGGAGHLVALNDEPSDAEILVVLGADFDHLGAASGIDGQSAATRGGGFVEGNVASAALPMQEAETPTSPPTTTVRANPGGSSDVPFPVAGCP